MKRKVSMKQTLDSQSHDIVFHIVIFVYLVNNQVGMRNWQFFLICL